MIISYLALTVIDWHWRRFGLHFPRIPKDPRLSLIFHNRRKVPFPALEWRLIDPSSRALRAETRKFAPERAAPPLQRRAADCG